MIAGSNSILGDITEIETEDIDITNKNTTFSVRADLNPPNESFSHRHFKC